MNFKWLGFHFGIVSFADTHYTLFSRFHPFSTLCQPSSKEAKFSYNHLGRYIFRHGCKYKQTLHQFDQKPKMKSNLKHKNRDTKITLMYLFRVVSMLKIKIFLNLPTTNLEDYTACSAHNCLVGIQSYYHTPDKNDRHPLLDFDALMHHRMM